MRRIRADHTESWYPGALCFKHRDKVHIEGNWFRSNYDVPFIAVVECDRTKRRCASPEQVEDFMGRHPFYFIKQRTVVDLDLFSR